MSLWGFDSGKQLQFDGTILIVNALASLWGFDSGKQLQFDGTILIVNALV
ncbi:MAG: hypothetical protein ACJ71Q_11095 [Terriglobales bacterium]